MWGDREDGAGGHRWGDNAGDGDVPPSPAEGKVPSRGGWVQLYTPQRWGRLDPLSDSHDGSLSAGTGTPGRGQLPSPQGPPSWHPPGSPTRASVPL